MPILHDHYLVATVILLYHCLQALFKMGLRPDTAFACAYKFLFAPNDAVRAAFSTEFDRLSTAADDDVLKIGINVRLGDWTFDPAIDTQIVSNLRVMEGAFECAEAIAAAKKPLNDTKVRICDELLTLVHTVYWCYNVKRTDIPMSCFLIVKLGAVVCNSRLCRAAQVDCRQVWN
jgi:hypothetical protein